MVVLFNGMLLGMNFVIKVKISSSSIIYVLKEMFIDFLQVLFGVYDFNLYLYDVNLWLEYIIYDFDYNNFWLVEMNNMNGENIDMLNYEKINGRCLVMLGYQNMDNEEGVEFQGVKFFYEKIDFSQFNDVVK